MQKRKKMSKKKIQEEKIILQICFLVCLLVYVYVYLLVAHASLSRHPLHAVSARGLSLSRVTQGGEYLHNRRLLFQAIALNKSPSQVVSNVFFSFSCHKQSQRRRKTSFALNIIFTSQVTFSALWISHVDCTVFRFNLSHMPQEDNKNKNMGTHILITSLLNPKNNV